AGLRPGDPVHGRDNGAGAGRALSANMAERRCGRRADATAGRPQADGAAGAVPEARGRAGGRVDRAVRREGRVSLQPPRTPRAPRRGFGPASIAAPAAESLARGAAPLALLASLAVIPTA